MIIKEAFKYIDDKGMTTFTTQIIDNAISVEKMIYLEADFNKRIIQNHQYYFITKYLTPEEYLTGEFEEEDDPKVIKEGG